MLVKSDTKARMALKQIQTKIVFLVLEGKFFFFLTNYLSVFYD